MIFRIAIKQSAQTIYKGTVHSNDANHFCVFSAVLCAPKGFGVMGFKAFFARGDVKIGFSTRYCVIRAFCLNVKIDFLPRDYVKATLNFVVA